MVSFKHKLANHPRAATALIAAFLVAGGAFWLVVFFVPCVGWLQPQEVFACMSKYIAKFAILAYPIAILAASLSVGLPLYLLNGRNSCQNPFYCAFLGAAGALLSYPVAAMAAVIVLKVLDEYWLGAQGLWMFKRFVIGGVWLTWPYAVIGAAMAGGLASLVVRTVGRALERPV